MDKKVFDELQNLTDGNDEVFISSNFVHNVKLPTQSIQKNNKTIGRIRSELKPSAFKDVQNAQNFASFLIGKNGECFLLADSIELNPVTKMWKAYTQVFDVLTKEEMQEVKDSCSLNGSYNASIMEHSKLWVSVSSLGGTSSKRKDIGELYLVNASNCLMLTNVQGVTEEFREKEVLPKTIDFDSWLSYFRTNTIVRDRGFGRIALTRAEEIVKLLTQRANTSIHIAGQMSPLDQGFKYNPQKQGSLPVQNAKGRFMPPESAYAILKGIYEHLGFKVIPFSYKGKFGNQTEYMSLLQKFIPTNSLMEEGFNESPEKE